MAIKRREERARELQERRPEETAAESRSSSEWRSVAKRLARRLVVALLVVVVVALAGLGAVRLLALRQNTLYPGGNLGNLSPAVLPGYQFFWKADAPGTLSVEQAYATAAYVQHPDGTDGQLVASLWVAQSADAALVVVQLDPRGHDLAVVPIVRKGSGSSAVWQAVAGTWPRSQHCSGTTESPDGMCAESAVHNPGGPLAENWGWSASDGTVGVAARFVEPLTASPKGGTLAGLTLSIGSAQGADGSTVVAVGTGSAAAVRRRAEQLGAVSYLP